MPTDDENPIDELARLYAGVMDALDGASAHRVQAALSMALLMTGENTGLAGEDLLAWIDQTSNSAKAIVRRLDGPRVN